MPDLIELPLLRIHKKTSNTALYEIIQFFQVENYPFDHETKSGLSFICVLMKSNKHLKKTRRSEVR